MRDEEIFDAELRDRHGKIPVRGIGEFTGSSRSRGRSIGRSRRNLRTIDGSRTRSLCGDGNGRLRPVKGSEIFGSHHMHPVNNVKKLSAGDALTEEKSFSGGNQILRNRHTDVVREPLVLPVRERRTCLEGTWRQSLPVRTHEESNRLFDREWSSGTEGAVTVAGDNPLLEPCLQIRRVPGFLIRIEKERHRRQVLLKPLHFNAVICIRGQDDLESFHAVDEVMRTAGPVTVAADNRLLRKI